jgi:hypothetical protein
MLVVVGGHSRNIGKTSVMASIIRMTSQLHWTAIKITQFGHGKCAKGGDCECAGTQHAYSLTEEKEASPKDSGRYLAAGADNSYWLRTRQGNLGHALPVLKKLMAENTNVICESNSILAYYAPDLYVMVVDGRVADIKDSARNYFDRANAFAVLENSLSEWPWDDVPQRWLTSKPLFPIEPPHYENLELGKLVLATALAKKI